MHIERLNRDLGCVDKILFILCRGVRIDELTSKFLQHRSGYPCHVPHFNATRCEFIQANPGNAYTRADNAGSMQMDNWEDKGTQRCAFQAPKSSPCRQGSVAVLGVQVESVADIQKAVKFAAQHKLRIAVKSSGHDYMGRSTAPGSFLIWMHKMKNITIDYAFPIAGGKCKDTDFVPAITVVGGVNWGEVYDKLNNTDYIVLGGMGLTICATGGYVQGGGHGALGPSFGLAVDNVLEIQVITADGRLQTLNACSEDPELFFALRGGGGGTFGVVTSVTYKLHRNPSHLVVAILLVSPPTGTMWSTAQQEEILTVWSRRAVAIDAAHWGGYWSFASTSFIGAFLAPQTEEAANKTFTPVAQAFSQLHNVTVTTLMSTTPSFQAWHALFYQTSKTGTDSTGGRAILGSRIVPYSALRNPNALAKSLVSAMSKSGTTEIEGIMVLGPGVRGADPHGVTSVTPAWRRGIWHVVASSSWSWNSTQAEEDAARKSQQVFVDVLHKAYPDSGAYLNEANIDEPRWKQSFWGKKNYARLLATKLRVDPFGLFVCRKCVGSDLQQNIETCRLQPSES